MPEILRTGKVSIKTYTCTCRKCDSQIKFKESEGRRDVDRDGHHMIFKCPIPSCRADIFVHTSVGVIEAVGGSKPYPNDDRYTLALKAGPHSRDTEGGWKSVPGSMSGDFNTHTE